MLRRETVTVDVNILMHIILKCLLLNLFLVRGKEKIIGLPVVSKNKKITILE